MDIRPDDRVLLTDLTELPLVQQVAAALTRGSLVGIGGDDEIRNARRRFAELDHVMFTPGTRDDIPWRDGSFTLIIDASPEAPSAEMRRVLHPEGRLMGRPTEAPEA